MTQEIGRERSPLIHQVNLPRASYSDEDEAWRSFLENPLTVASKAMLSISGDEDSAAALSLLYDYYKVPREKKVTPIKTEAESPPSEMEPSTLEKPDLAMASLRTVPLNLLSQWSVPGWDKSSDPAGDTAPHYAVSPEGRGAFPSHRGQSDAMAFSHQPSHSFGHFSARAQGPTINSIHAESTRMSSAEDLHVTSATSGSYSGSSKMESGQFEYTLEAPRSIRQKNGNCLMSYLNKGHFYPITLRRINDRKAARQQGTMVRSVVMLVFGEEKCVEDQLKYWKFWHSRQPTAKQRCIDIADYKGSFNMITCIEEISFNAVSFTWNTNDEPQIYVSVNCLSTDFSSQKGVKGLPINLQIDTYSCGSHGDQVLIHRACCKVKVFCDKGAERKIRDEERKMSRRKGKSQDSHAAGKAKAAGKDALLQSHVYATPFEPVSDLVTQPVLFIPDVQFPGSQKYMLSEDDGVNGVAVRRSPYSAEEEFGCSPDKRARRDGAERVLLYVRREADEVFDALMLRTPTLAGLLQAISDKYNLPSEKICRIYKRCKKGILVNMDDVMVKHYTNEDTFQIDFTEQGGLLTLTLTEI
ncbi:grainyhead-like protein 1 homolog [Denticeps clupeoides]|uniref:grainyhead-like protein 1 homolog n=1 Tax=Denticeps clupeoides TaxID=299321 RepID=UPI0010A56EE0|nr:grainyhead-like protein 1 homolog [Denticeps clupeoides]